jgi:hypothetical protein
VKPAVRIPLILLLAVALSACGGPALQYDKPPAPGWINQPPTGIDSATLTGVGGSPATIEIARDSDMATRTAKSRVAQLFESKINSRLSDWTLALTGGVADINLDGATRSIEVSTGYSGPNASTAASPTASRNSKKTSPPPKRQPPPRSPWPR